MPRIQRYVSKELSHFVARGKPAAVQFEILVRILRSGWLTHPPHNPNISGSLTVNPEAKLSTNEMYSPQMVCFCDIPVEDLHIHTAKYSSFGLSFSKGFIAARGGAPVFYVPRGARIRQFWNLPSKQALHGLQAEAPMTLRGVSSEEEITLGDLFDRMLPEFHSMVELFYQMIKTIKKLKRSATLPDEFWRLLDLHRFLEFRVFSYVKFFDESLEDDGPKNFYMEREWRVVGNVRFDLSDVRRVIIPSSYAMHLRSEVPDFYGQVTFAD